MERSQDNWIVTLCTIARFTALLFCVAIVLFFTSTSQPILNETVSPGRSQILQFEFDFTGWTINALLNKWSASSLGISDALSPIQQESITTWYQELQQQRKTLQASIESFYIDPTITDPAASSAHFQEQLDKHNAAYSQVKTLTEVVLQRQAIEVLRSMNLGWSRLALPHPLFTFSDLPNQVILSPRDTIRVAADYTLIADLSVSQIELIESSIEESGNFSALVESLGGIATYPSMVNSGADFEFLLETIAHEWTHHYLAVTPLGLGYFKDSQVRTMNETAASIAGKEIARHIIARFYPSLLPREQRSPRFFLAAFPSTASQPFDFRREMHLTRVTVDLMLSQGKITEAENYLEQRRKIFWENGYTIRRLNQAYFAFHGSYADTPFSAAGADPVGAAVRVLRERSHSLADFLNRVSRLSSYTQLSQVVSSY